MNLKKIIITLVQAAVTLLLLWWIFHDPSKRAQMALALGKANPLWLVPAFLSFGLVLVCAAFRWQLLMRVQGISLSWFRVWQLVMIGMFYNLFLPGGTGGDLVKIFYAVREAPNSKSAVFLSVVVDRLAGMFALILVSSGVFLVFFKQLTALPMVRGFTVAVCVIFAATLVLVAVGLIVDRFHLASRIPSTMPGHAAILDTARAFSVYARDWRAVVVAVLISLPLNLFIFSGAIFAATAFPGNPGPAAMTSVIPVVNTISALPISLAGIGVREKLFSSMLHSLYATPEDLGVLISITGFAIMVCWSLIGGVISMLYRSGEGAASLHEIEGEVGSIEKRVEDEERAS
jgi:glycosyltransferase 2 family protein